MTFGQCSNCGWQLDSSSLKCPACGYKFKLSSTFTGVSNNRSQPSPTTAEPPIEQWRKEMNAPKSFSQESMAEVRRQAKVRSAKKFIKPLAIILALVLIIAAILIAMSYGVFAATQGKELQGRDVKRPTECMGLETRLKGSMAKSQSIVNGAQRSWQNYERKSKSIVTGQDKLDAQRLFKIAMKGSIDAMRSYLPTMRLALTQPRCWKADTFDSIRITTVAYEAIIAQMDLYEKAGLSDLLSWSASNDSSAGDFLNPKNFGGDPMLKMLQEGFIRNN